MSCLSVALLTSSHFRNWSQFTNSKSGKQKRVILVASDYLLIALSWICSLLSSLACYIVPSQPLVCRYSVTSLASRNLCVCGIFAHGWSGRCTHGGQRKRSGSYSNTALFPSEEGLSLSLEVGWPSPPKLEMTLNSWPSFSPPPQLCVTTPGQKICDFYLKLTSLVNLVYLTQATHVFRYSHDQEKGWVHGSMSEIKCLGPKRMCKRAGNAGTSFKRCFLLVFLIFNGNLH